MAVADLFLEARSGEAGRTDGRRRSWQTVTTRGRDAVAGFIRGGGDGRVGSGGRANDHGDREETPAVCGERGRKGQICLPWICWQGRTVVMGSIMAVEAWLDGDDRGAAGVWRMEETRWPEMGWAIWGRWPSLDRMVCLASLLVGRADERTEEIADRAVMGSPAMAVRTKMGKMGF